MGVASDGEAERDAARGGAGGGAPLAYLPQKSITARTGAAKLLWARELVVDDLGLFT